MKRKVLGHVLTAIGLSVWLYVWGCIEVSQIVGGSTQGKKDPTVDLPKVENPDVTGIDSRSFIVSIAAEGEFYVAGQRLTREALAATIRDALRDRASHEQKIYVRCSASLKFRAVRQLLNVIRQVGFERVEFVVESWETRGDGVVETQIFTAIGVKVDPSDSISVPPPLRESSRSPAPPPPALPTRPLPPAPRTRVTMVAPDPPLGAGALVVEVEVEAGSGDPAIALNRVAVPLVELRPTLLTLFAPRSNYRVVVIKPSQDITYDDLITVMAESRSVGADYVCLLIDEAEVPRGIMPPPRRPSGVATTEDLHVVSGGVPGVVPAGVPDETPRIIRKSGGLLQRSAARRVEPATPPLAKVAKVTGAVVVQVTIDELGEVIDARAVAGHPYLKDAAVEAARGWKFKPTRLNGEAFKVIGTLTFVFKE